MIATNYTTLRDRMKSYFDQVTDESETLVVTRKGGANVIVISDLNSHSKRNTTEWKTSYGVR